MKTKKVPKNSLPAGNYYLIVFQYVIQINIQLFNFSVNYIYSSYIVAGKELRVNA